MKQLQKTDILIIGAGAVGVAIAREFSKYCVRVLVVEKNDDVGGEATKACSSIAGTGYANPPGSLMARLSHRSHEQISKIIDELEIHANRCGCIMPAFHEEDIPVLEKRIHAAQENGDTDVVLLTREQALEMEPDLSSAVCAAIWSPREIVIDTFGLVVAQAENAAENGAEFLLSAEVTAIKPLETSGFRVTTTAGDVEAAYVINAAGLHCDEIHRMVEPIDFTVHPRKGQFYILDKSTLCKPKHVIMPVPTLHTRGKLVLPTAAGNVLVGPTAEDQQDKSDTDVTREGLEEIAADVRMLIPGVALIDVVTEFAGLRPVRMPEGYHIGFSKCVPGFFSISGVRSDGVTTSLGIAEYVRELFEQRGICFEKKRNFIAKRRAIRRISDCTQEQRAALIAEDPLYGNIICRCETVSEAEIIEAIHRVPGAKSLDGIKRRLRVGMGRCQGGFCTPRVVEILAREMKVEVSRITKKGGKSVIAPYQNR